MVRTQMANTSSPANERKMSEWNRDSHDAICLRTLINNGLITNMGPKKVMEAHLTFQKYAYPTFQSALKNMRRTYNNSLQKRDSAIGKL